MRILLIIFLSFGVVYFLYQKDSKAKLHQSKEYDKVSNNNKKISNNVPILDTIKEIYFLKKINKNTYNDFLVHLNNFYLIIEDFNIKQLNLRQNFDVLLDERKKMLNSISSMIYTCPPEYENILESCISKLEEKTYIEISTLENKLNNLWEDEIDNNKREYNIEEPKPNDMNINKNYDLY